MDETKKNSCDEGASKMPASGIDATVGSFASRMKQKLQEQAAHDNEAARAKETRQGLILSGMTNIRRALQETCKIELGERFSFRLQTGDWEGWPRVELILVDALAPNTVEHSLVVTANDRKELGTIAIDTKAPKRLGQVNLQKAEDFPRIQVVLKRALRDFLDTVGAYILNPKKPTEVIECMTKPLDTGSFDVVGEKLIHEDLFNDEDSYSPNQNTVEDASEPEPIPSEGGIPK